MRRRWLGVGLVAAIAGAALVPRERWQSLGKIVASLGRGQAARLRQPRRQRGIRFKPGSRVALDVYTPLNATNCPVLISVHGGGWRLWHRHTFGFTAAPLVERGLVVIVPDYTLYPLARYEQMTDECAAAVAWTLDHIGEYGGDPTRVYLQGHSAGSHLSGLVSLDRRWLAAYDHSPDELRGVILSAGVLDVEAEQERWKRMTHLPIEAGPYWGVMGSSHDALRAASPIRHVRGDAPPTLVMHGEADPIVPVRVGRAFYEALRDAGADVTWRAYRGQGHADMLFDAALDTGAPFNEDVLAFIERTSGPVDAGAVL